MNDVNVGIRIKPEHFEDGMAPGFFFERWMKKNPSTDNPVEDYFKEENIHSFTMSLCLTWVFMVLMMPVFFLFTGKGGSVLLPMSLTSFAIPFLYKKVWNNVQKRNGHRFFSELSEFYRLFGIELDVKTGSMSENDFKGLVEKILKSHGKERGGKERDMFDKMLEMAERWGLSELSSETVRVYRFGDVETVKK